MRPTDEFPNEAPPRCRRSYISCGPLLATGSRAPWKQTVETMGAFPLREFLVNITRKYKTRQAAAAFLVCVFVRTMVENEEKRVC